MLPRKKFSLIQQYFSHSIQEKNVQYSVGCVTTQLFMYISAGNLFSGEATYLLPMRARSKFFEISENFIIQLF